MKRTVGYQSTKIGKFACYILACLSSCLITEWLQLPHEGTSSCHRVSVYCTVSCFAGSVFTSMSVSKRFPVWDTFEKYNYRELSFHCNATFFCKKDVVSGYHAIYLLINIHKGTKPTVSPMSRPYTVVCHKMVVRPSPCGTRGCEIALLIKTIVLL